MGLWVVERLSAMADERIDYVTSLEGIRAEMLSGFFEGWVRKPSAETHLRMLRGSSHVVLAMVVGERGERRVVGFINAISDGFFAAQIPFLEVVPEYRGRGIGTELVGRMLTMLEGFYGVALSCDAELVPFYERRGFRAGVGMGRLNHERQATGAG